MPTPNPRYNPHWKVIHDYHSAERSRVDEEMQFLTQRDKELFDLGHPHDSDERLEIIRRKEVLHAEWDAHQRACLDSIQMQHPTIEEYAKWVFRFFDPACGWPGAVTPAINFDDIKTLDDVGNAWKRANQAVRDQLREGKQSEQDTRNHTAKTKDDRNTSRNFADPSSKRPTEPG